MLLTPIQDEFNAIEASVDGGPVFPDVTPAEIRGHLASHYDFRAPIALDIAVADVEKMLRRWQVQITHPRYLGLFNPSVTFSSVIADTLVAAYNPQLASWRTSPAANEIERHTLAWLLEKFGFPSTAIATFTNGGAEANFSAVVAALEHAFPHCGDEGLGSLIASPVLYLSTEAHHSFTKIAQMCGIGRKALRSIPADGELKMDVKALAAAIEKDRKDGLAPFMVVGTAGTTAAGAIDRLDELATLCRNEKLWFHVDAAWGGAAIVSPKLRQHLAGIEKADSITCDAHKWFSVSMACGMFFCRHRETIARAFRVETSYMPGSAGAETFDPYTNSVQWSRRFTGLKLFLSLVERGEAGQAGMIEHQARMGALLRECLSAAGWRVANTTPLPVVCFTRDGLEVPAFVESVRKNQIAWISDVKIKGAPFVRACITSYKTTEEEVREIVRRITELFAERETGHAQRNGLDRPDNSNISHAHAETLDTSKR
jgi:glutamate/tyrosine decarboxylase-like PLP-dependent enzyme